MTKLTKQRGTVRIQQPTKRRTSTTIVAVALGTALLLQPVALLLPPAYNVAAAATTAQALKALNEEMITSGAKLIHYQWTQGDGEISNVHVIEVDLTNPYVKLDVMNGKTGAITGKSSVGNMVKTTGAVAGINADFFDTSSAAKGNPMGAQVNEGQLVTSSSQLNGMYAFAVTADRKPIVDLFTFQGTIVAQDGATFPLAGLNKGAYRTDPSQGYSHANAAHIYTSAWTAARPSAAESSATPTEVLIVDNVVQQIAVNSMIPGTPPANGFILRTHGTAAKFVAEHLPVGSTVNANYSLVASSTGQPVDTASLQMLVGGHTILVDQGRTTAFSRDITGVSGSSEVSRTTVGYSQDGTKAYLITVEAAGESEGMSLKELQTMMVQLGVWKGINLDGGGSTTMISRPLGDTETTLAHETQNGSQRAVTNGLGIYTLAPAGQLRGLSASGSTVLFVGQQASYSLKGYDTFYNPIDAGAVAATWTDAQGLGTFSGSTYTAKKAGKTSVKAISGSISDKLEIEIIGGEQIEEMTIAAGAPVLEAGKSFEVPVKAVLADGRKVTIPAGSVKWELSGFAGSVKDGVLTVQSAAAGSATGYAIARYDGFSAMLVLTAGSNMKFEDFEAATYPITFQSTNAVTGGVALVSDLPEQASAKALQLDYDFSQVASGTKAAYAVLNGSGRQVEGKPSSMTVDVYGDGSLNWLRAEFIDAAGKAYPVTLADKITFAGWKQLKADLPAGVTYPVKLKRLYVASLQEDQDERALTGQVVFDNIGFQYPASVETKASPSIQLTLGSKTASIGGKATKLDVAPIALEGTTYLPLRFVADAMGAKINWEGTLKRVTVLRGDRLLEMWLGKSSFLLNGSRSESEVAPISRGGRTLVPIRLVSEQLGLKVGWDPKTGVISVE
ncbi:stalk domain-containing protein [Paenibacillus xanthanilyticus]|uniref:Stalk domain-containing protein n=1 Tax=Paenibacillus xanthanilyticus TaxID=1783531 RepID=A0ABV8K2Y1_9BACL